MSGSVPPQSSLILYQTEDGRTRIQGRFEDETIWLTQAQIAELFQVTVPTVNEHLKGIYAEGEVPSEATIRKFRIVRSEGSRDVTRELEHYNLEAILAVGYRARSAARRRTAAEAEAEHAAMQQLEDIPKKLPALKKPRRGPGAPRKPKG
jgi:hypothetical protein